MKRTEVSPDLGPEQVDLVQDMAVLAADGRVLGRLEEARCPGTAHLAQWLVVRRGLTDRRIVANAQVIGGRGDALLTGVRPAAWRQLAPAMPDDELQAEVEAALAGDQGQAESLLRSLRLRVEAQRVFIEGYLANQERIQEVERRVRALPGVLAVGTRIVTDGQLETAVARALSGDPRTGSQPIRVRATLGRVDLLGQASTPEAATAADRVAASVPGVLAVHTYLVLGAPRSPQGQTVAAV
jgi:osmotically-inducible protein OsmY